MTQQSVRLTQIETLAAQGKSYIIKEALFQLERKNPSLTIKPHEYAISVWFNKTDVQVRLRRLICYERKGLHFHYDIAVNLVSETISPFDDWYYRGDFFVPTADQQKTIDLVAQVTGVFKGYYADHQICTSEDEHMIYVQIRNDVSFRNLFLDKVTGKERLSSMHGSYLSPPAYYDFPEKSETSWKEITE